jgi:hypothetical protein
VRRKLLPSEIPHVENMVVVLKLAGYSRSQMGKVIGLSRGQIREILEKPEVNEQIVHLRAGLPQAALDLLQGYMVEAVQVFVDVMRTSPVDKDRMEAAAQVLDRAGLPKASRQERLQVNEERTVFTDEGIVDRLREAPVEIQEKAAQLIEGLEKLLEASAGAVAVEDDNEPTE